MSLEIKKAENNDYSRGVVKVNFYSAAYVYGGSFGNCQTFTVNKFEKIPKEKYYNFFIESVKFFNNERKQCVIDIKTQLCETVEKEFISLDIPFQKLPYISTNDSSMCIYILNLKNIKPKDENIKLS